MNDQTPAVQPQPQEVAPSPTTQPSIKDPTVVAQIRSAAEDALARGFAILTCQPYKKDPWPLYSPHAVNSCSRVPEIALKPWTDGFVANYGVGGGPSNLTIIDVDKGIPNYAALRAWMETQGLPETFIVQSGRAGFGAHLYYSGAVPTTPYDMDGVVGELRGNGAYVVGPGSIHPDGNRYTIINDVDIVPLPDKFIALAADKKKSMDFKPGMGHLIPAGNRWAHLQSKAGTFRNAGLDRDGIYAALKNFAENNCEDGANYPDDKIQALAEWAASGACDTVEQSVVFVGDPTAVDTSIKRIPMSAIDGDWIGDLAHLVTDGTFIPTEFARADIKTILSASIDGLVGFPTQKDLHTRQWTMKISEEPESGKGESWKRTGGKDGALADYIYKTEVRLPKSGKFSSGEHLVKYLSSDFFKDKNSVAHFDEMTKLFNKAAGQGSTLMDVLLELFEDKEASSGSLTNKGGEFENVSLSMVGGFTRAGFDQALAGRSTGGTGFMSRCCLVYGMKQPTCGDWPEQDKVAIEKVTGKMLQRHKDITEEVSKQRVNNPKWRFVPNETDEARTLRLNFEKTLLSGKEDLRTERIISHFKRDLLCRVIFSDTPDVITADATNRSITWATHELYLRDELWAVDSGGLVERMELAMKKRLKKAGKATKAQLRKFCHVNRAGSGGEETFRRAWQAVTSGGEDAAIVPLGNLSQKRTQWWVLGGSQ